MVSGSQISNTEGAPQGTWFPKTFYIEDQITLLQPLCVHIFRLIWHTKRRRSFYFNIRFFHCIKLSNYCRAPDHRVFDYLKYRKQIVTKTSFNPICKTFLALVRSKIRFSTVTKNTNRNRWRINDNFTTNLIVKRQSDCFWNRFWWLFVPLNNSYFLNKAYFLHLII